VVGRVLEVRHGTTERTNSVNRADERHYKAWLYPFVSEATTRVNLFDLITATYLQAIRILIMQFPTSHLSP
jgi:hypothetical protein